MAQKLALALFALFGFANSQILRVGTVKLLAGPAPHYYGGLTRHDDDNHHEEASEKGSEQGSGPRLGTKVVLGRPVVLGETQGHSQHGGQHDEGKGFVVVNYASIKGGERKGYEKRKEKEDERVVIIQHEEPHPQVRVVRIQREEPHPEVRVVRIQRQEHHQEHSEHEDPKVNIPVFGKLKNVENDEHGESVKAPIAIVTAPLVSTARTDKHKVGVNQVVGEENDEQREHENKDAKRVTKSSNKALFKNVDKLSTKIEGPIKNPIVVHDEESSEHNDESSVSEEGGKHHHGERKETGAAHINYKKLQKQLAIGDARENAPFVVRKTVFTSSKHLSREQDHHEEHSHHDHEEKRERHEVSSSKHD